MRIRRTQGPGRRRAIAVIFVIVRTVSRRHRPPRKRRHIRIRRLRQQIPISHVTIHLLHPGARFLALLAPIEQECQNGDYDYRSAPTRSTSNNGNV